LNLYTKTKKCGETSNATHLIYIKDSLTTGVFTPNAPWEQGSAFAYVSDDNYFEHPNFTISSSYITADWFA